MAPKSKGGGRGRRGVMADVLGWAAKGTSAEAARSKLKASGYSASRIAQLLKGYQPLANDEMPPLVGSDDVDDPKDVVCDDEQSQEPLRRSLLDDCCTLSSSYICSICFLI